MKASGIFLVPGDDYMGQHINSINNPGPQVFFLLEIKKGKKTGSNKHTRNHV